MSRSLCACVIHEGHSRRRVMTLNIFIVIRLLHLSMVESHSTETYLGLHTDDVKLLGLRFYCGFNLEGTHSSGLMSWRTYLGCLWRFALCYGHSDVVWYMLYWWGAWPWSRVNSLVRDRYRCLGHKVHVTVPFWHLFTSCLGFSLDISWITSICFALKAYPTSYSKGFRLKTYQL